MRKQFLTVRLPNGQTVKADGVKLADVVGCLGCWGRALMDVSAVSDEASKGTCDACGSALKTVIACVLQ